MITDVHVYLDRWPFRRLPHDEPARLTAKLRESDVAQAWAGSFDAVLHRDVAAVNLRVAETCQAQGAGLLLPVGAVNLSLPDWREDLRRCHEQHQMRVIRLHPNYHGYKLETPEFSELLGEAGRRGLVVQLAVKMEDERTHHPLVRLQPVDLQPLEELLRRHASTQLVLLNSLRSLRGDALAKLARLDNVAFEIAMLEGVGGIEQLLTTAPLERLLFGSYFPFFYLESSLLKLRESEIGGLQLEKLCRTNAQQLLDRAAAAAQ